MRVILTPSPVNLRHGTGAQLAYLCEEFPMLFRAVNYGTTSAADPDQAQKLESGLASCWPTQKVGRRFWFDLCERMGFSYWYRHRLNRSGAAYVSREISLASADGLVAVISAEDHATRVNSVVDALRDRPLSIILYDFESVDPVKPERFPQFCRALQSAATVFCISEPLATMARSAGATDVQPIGFYKPPPAQRWEGHSGHRPEEPFKLFLVGSLAHHVALEELICCTARLSEHSTGSNLEIHYVGRDLDRSGRLPAGRVTVVHHGPRTNAERDAIAHDCHAAFLAGPTDDPGTCPFSKYSIPSKLGDFAGAGLPVVARVAPGSAVEALLRGPSLRFAWPATTEWDLYDGLRTLLLDEPRRLAMREAALAFAETDVFLPNAATNFVNRLAGVTQSTGLPR